MITPQDLERVGRACFGEQWQHDLARHLGVSDRKIRYWMAGHPDHPIPGDTAIKLISMGQYIRDRIYTATRDLFPSD